MQSQKETAVDTTINKYSDLFELKGTFSLICLNGKTWRRRQRLYCRHLKVEDLSSSLTTSYSQRQFFSASLSFLLIDDRIRHRQRLYFWSFFDLRGRCLNHLSSIPSSSNFQSFDRIGSAEGEERVEQEHSPHVQLKKKKMKKKAEEEEFFRGLYRRAAWRPINFLRLCRSSSRCSPLFPLYPSSDIFLSLLIATCVHSSCLFKKGRRRQRVSTSFFLTFCLSLHIDPSRLSPVLVYIWIEIDHGVDCFLTLLPFMHIQISIMYFFLFFFAIREKK